MVSSIPFDVEVRALRSGTINGQDLGGDSLVARFFSAGPVNTARLKSKFEPMSRLVFRLLNLKMDGTTSASPRNDTGVSGEKNV